MTFSLLATAFATTLLGVAIHVAWWKVRRPRDDALALTVLVGLLPFILTALATWFLPLTSPRPGWSASFLVAMAAIGVLHAIMSMVYTTAYTAVQAASPTVLIVLSASHSPDGITRGDLEGRLTDDLVSGNLVHAAIDERFLEQREDRLYLGRRGRSLLRLGRLARKLAGLAPPVG